MTAIVGISVPRWVCEANLRSHVEIDMADLINRLGGAEIAT